MVRSRDLFTLLWFADTWVCVFTSVQLYHGYILVAGVRTHDGALSRIPVPPLHSHCLSHYMSLKGGGVLVRVGGPVAGARVPRVSPLNSCLVSW